jgi:hypothetical protein
MKSMLIAAAIVLVAAAVAPVRADQISGSDQLMLGPGSFYGYRDVFGRGRQQENGKLGYGLKNSNPGYGYWGTGPDYGNYKWPFTGPYDRERPRGRPMDALTYAPVPIEASAAGAKVLGGNAIRVSWPGGPGGVNCVTFDILDEVGNVMVRQAVTSYPFAADMPLPSSAQKVRVTVNYTDGFSTNVFWVPW